MMFCLVKKVGVRLGDRRRDPGFIGETDDWYAESLRERSQVQTFESEAAAKFARDTVEAMDWQIIQSLAADVRDRTGDDPVDDTRFALVEFIGRHHETATKILEEVPGDGPEEDEGGGSE
ncbi:MAG: hypothetical protein ABEN55_12185 [Bradymonadaceae bacterium]